MRCSCGSRRSCSGGPSSRIWPWSNITTRSATSRAKPISWVTSIIVVAPSSAMSRSTFRTSPTSSGSSAEVTSSNSMTAGSVASARAIATRCFCPPDSWPGVWLACVGEPDLVEQLHARSRASSGDLPVHLHRRQHDVLERAHVREQVEVLEHHPDVGAHRADVLLARRLEPVAVLLVVEVPATDLDGAAVGSLEGHDHPQDRGLARAGRPDDDHPLAGRDVEVELAQDHVVAEGLVDAPHADAGGALRRDVGASESQVRS